MVITDLTIDSLQDLKRNSRFKNHILIKKFSYSVSLLIGFLINTKLWLFNKNLIKITNYAKFNKTLVFRFCFSVKNILYKFEYYKPLMIFIITEAW